MKTDKFQKLFLILVFCSFFISASYAQDAEKTEMKKQYIYKLKLIPELLDEKNWTEKENNIVGSHFFRLKEFTEKGTVILAGRTLNMDETQFGIVIFEAADDIEAEKFMNDDPAVKEKIMTSELFPFYVALIKN